MSNESLEPLPQDVQTFMEKMIDFYLRGSRGHAFAEWSVSTATLILERRGLLY